MATSDLSKAVNNILSSHGQVAPKTTKGTSPKKSGTTRSGFGGLGDVIEQGGKVVQEVSGAAGQAISGLTADLTSLPQLQNVLGDALDTSTPIEPRQFNPFDPVDAHGARVMATKLIEIAENAGDDGLAVAIGVTDSFGALLGGIGGLVPGLDSVMGTVTAGVADVAREIVGAVGQDVLGRVGLKERALMLFVTHYPPAHQQIIVDPFDVRLPNLVSRLNSKAWPEEENRLNFWREDALLNDHHGRWHDVNPWEGRPAGQTKQVASHPIIVDRNGELFAYMHEQMLARYDAERVAVNLDRVEGWPSGKDKHDYGERMPQGYKPGDRVGRKRDDGQFFLYRERPSGATIMDLDRGTADPNDKLENMKRFDDALNEAASRGYFLIPEKPDPQGPQEKIPITTDNFGNAVQASIGSVDWPDKEDPFRDKNGVRNNNGKNYGNHHASGHIHIAWFDGKLKTSNGMIDLYATSRDPMFWRWHKHVDDVIQAWRKELPPHDDLTNGTRVKIRSEDIILCGKDLPADIDGGEFGKAAFGNDPTNSKGNPWDTDFSERKVTATATVTTKEEEEKSSGKKAEPKKVPVTVTTATVLWTEMKKRTIHPLDVGEENKGEKDNEGKPVQQPSRKLGPAVDEVIDYLSHDDFSYFIRLENLSNETQTVTVRIFLAPEELIQIDPRDSTIWIEMDRFLYQLGSHERTVVFRPAKLSAVIRKPAVGPTELENPELRKSSADNWCDCGWPYTLLLPRGTEAGMDFRLVVIISGDDLAMYNSGEDLTSMSHCGLKDSKYPDKRPMGYPFDRPLPDAIDSIVDQHENWASRTIKIRRRS